jgi:TonB family protein
MMRRAALIVFIALLTSGPGRAQGIGADFPKRLLFARLTFFDFGPPFDFYEVLSLEDRGTDTEVKRMLVTPAGNACIQPPSVETEVTTIHKSLEELLHGKNPCRISEKAVRQERKRCKHCLVFSGVNVTLTLSCKGEERRIRMDILDKDLFERSPNTPPNTSWTMAVLSQLDDNFGPGVMDKPALSLGAPKPKSSITSDATMLAALKNGEYDGLFDSNTKLSELYRESQEPSRLPSVQLLSVTPVPPVSGEVPQYPPIARAAHVEGEVKISFEISSTGKVESLLYDGGSELFRASVTDAVSRWQFPPTSDGRREQATIAFRLNCPQPHP